MINERYIWFVWSISFLIPWVLIFLVYPGFRKIMIWSSLFTLPFGLTEPIFVPEYWTPPSLFDLAINTGFDIESFIFCFGIGGVGAVLYNVITGKIIEKVSESYRHLPIHRYHYLAISAPFISFPVLYFFSWNPIYPAIIAMLIGALTNILCRPDLKFKTWIGGVLFMFYYLVFLEGLNFISPGYIEGVWNLSAISGIMIFHLPIEEYLFAFGFGMFWAGVYEHFTWRRSVP